MITDRPSREPTLPIHASSRRHGLTVAIVAGATLGAPAVSAAQVTVSARLGLVASTALLEDSIVEAISLRPNPAPSVGIAIDTRLDPHYAVGAGIAVSRSDLRSRAASGDASVTTLTLWQPSIFLRYGANPWLGLEARAGALIYDPSTTVGNLFSGGAPVAPSLGLTASAERPLGGRLRAGLALQYDVHRFTTSTLENRGYSGSTVVHRIGVAVTLRHQMTHARSPAR